MEIGTSKAPSRALAATGVALFCVGTVSFVPSQVRSDRDDVGTQPAPSHRVWRWGDFDGDGLPDLYLTATAGGDRLLRNLGDGDFEDVTQRANLPAGLRAREVLWEDYDRDEHVDLFILTRSGICVLFRNDGGSGFVESSRQAGLPVRGGFTQAEWIDYDQDGFPDLNLAAGNGHALYHNAAGVFDPVLLPEQEARIVVVSVLEVGELKAPAPAPGKDDDALVDGLRRRPRQVTPGARRAVLGGELSSGTPEANDPGTPLPVMIAGGFWQTGGNPGTNPGEHYVGTSDNKRLIFKVNKQQVLRLEPVLAGTPNLLGGSSINHISPGVEGGTIGGGGEVNGINTVSDSFGAVGGGSGNTAGNSAGSKTDAAFATVAGGETNTARDRHSSVGGGQGNTADGSGATVSGGENNMALKLFATVGGGQDNEAKEGWSTVGGGNENEADQAFSTVAGGNDNHAIKNSATVGGGSGNIADGNGSTVPGGSGNTASGICSFAAGQRAKALHKGAFVWADSKIEDFSSDRDDQFKVRARGGMFVAQETSAADAGRFELTSTSSQNFALVGKSTSDDAAGGGVLAQGAGAVSGMNPGPKAAALQISNGALRVEGPTKCIDRLLVDPMGQGFPGWMQIFACSDDFCSAPCAHTHVMGHFVDVTISNDLIVIGSLESLLFLTVQANPVNPPVAASFSVQELGKAGPGVSKIRISVLGDTSACIPPTDPFYVNYIIVNPVD